MGADPAQPDRRRAGSAIQRATGERRKDPPPTSCGVGLAGFVYPPARRRPHARGEGNEGKTRREDHLPSRLAPRAGDDDELAYRLPIPGRAGSRRAALSGPTVQVALSSAGVVVTGY